MGFFNALNTAHQALPTQTDIVKDEAVNKDVEKSVPISPRGQQNVDPEVEIRIVRKMDLRIVSLVTALYILAFLDRSNIGNARIAGMQHDLSLVGNRYSWLLTIFYITYVRYLSWLIGLANAF